MKLSALLVQRRQISAILLITLFTLTGCPAIKPTSATAFSTGLSTARTQTTTAFDSVAVLTRTSAIDYASHQSALNEALFVTVPDKEAIAAWNKVLGPLEHYAQQLATLAAGGAVGNVDTATTNLANEFNTVSSDLASKLHLGSGAKVSASLASAFASFADAIRAARAQKEATAVAAKTDAYVRAICTGLADAIGESADDGLRATARANWSAQLIQVQEAFLKENTPEKRKPIATQFVALLDKRDAQDALLASLRQTYLALADAHTALSASSESGLRSALDFIATELQHARDLQAKFSTTIK